MYAKFTGQMSLQTNTLRMYNIPHNVIFSPNLSKSKGFSKAVGFKTGNKLLQFVLQNLI